MMAHGSEWLAILGEPMRDSLYEIGMDLGRRQHTETAGGVQVLLREFVGADAGAIVGRGDEVAASDRTEAAEDVSQVDRSMNALHDARLAPVPDGEQRWVECRRETIQRSENDE